MKKNTIFDDNLNIMALDKEFFDNIGKLEKCKANPGLIDFFDTISKLEKLGEEISNRKRETPSDTTKLDKQARGLTKALEEKKDEIATRTKTQKEYDAVYECIEYLGTHFNHQK